MLFWLAACHQGWDSDLLGETHHNISVSFSCLTKNHNILEVNIFSGGDVHACAGVLDVGNRDSEGDRDGSYRDNAGDNQGDDHNGASGVQ